MSTSDATPPSSPPPPGGSSPNPHTPGDEGGGARRDANRMRAAAQTFRKAMETGGREHPRVRAWLEARGIQVDRLIGGRVPYNLLYSPACQDYSFELKQKGLFPAMVARCETPLDQPHEVTLVHRTFFDGERAAKRQESSEWGMARKYSGDPAGHVIWLSPRKADEYGDGTVIKSVEDLGPYPGGVLVLGEGIETTLAVMAGAGNLAGVSCMDVGGLRAALFDESLFEPFTPDGHLKPTGHWIHTLVLAGDLDASGAGQAGVLDAYERYAMLYPRLTIRSFLPRAEIPGGLVEVAGSGEISECKTCKGSGTIDMGRTKRPCSVCGGRGDVGFRRGQHRPRLGADGFPRKSVDWNDVLLLTPELTGLPGVDGATLINIEFGKCVTAGEPSFVEAIQSAARRSMAWQRGTAGVMRPSGVRTAEPVAEAAKGDGAARVGQVGTPRGVPALEKEGGGAAGNGASGGAAGGKGGGNWWDGSCGGIVRWYEGFPDPVISPRPSDRAKAFLVDQCKPGKGMRRFRLLYWGSVFWWFNDVFWVKLDAEHMQIRQMLREWLERFKHVKRFKKGLPEIVPITARKKDLQEIIDCLAAEVFASSDSMPVFLPPSLDENGDPPFGEAIKTWERPHGGVRHHSLEGDANGYIVFRNGLLDRQSLIRDRRVRLIPPTSDLFTQAFHDYELPVLDLQEMLDGGVAGEGLRPAILNRLCPHWWNMLHDMTADDKGNPEVNRAARMRQLGMMFGDTIGADRRIEKIHLVPGAQRSGKGCIEEAVKAMMGERNIAMTTMFDLGGDRFALAPLVGCNVAMMSDAHIGKMMDGSLAAQTLKTIRGNGSVSVRDLYQSARPNVKISARFWIMTNEEMAIQDNSGALAGSFVVWPTTRSFFGREDPGVKEGITREGPGIAAWALYWHAELFAMPRPKIEMDELGRAIAEELAESGSNMRQFLKTCLVCDEALGIPRFDPDEKVFVWYRDCNGQPGLYDVYTRWCERQKKHPLADNRLVSRVRAIVAGVGELKQKRLHTDKGDESQQRPRVLYGVRLRDDLDAWLARGSRDSTAAPGAVVHTYGGSGGLRPQLEQDDSLPFMT